nr:MAG TPA: hypothetical protein [Caudoviricetes sp.]
MLRKYVRLHNQKNSGRTPAKVNFYHNLKPKIIIPPWYVLGNTKEEKS